MPPLNIPIRPPMLNSRVLSLSLSIKSLSSSNSSKFNSLYVLPKYSKAISSRSSSVPPPVANPTRPPAAFLVLLPKLFFKYSNASFSSPSSTILLNVSKTVSSSSASLVAKVALASMSVFILLMSFNISSISFICRLTIFSSGFISGGRLSTGGDMPTISSNTGSAVPSIVLPASFKETESAISSRTGALLNPLASLNFL